MEVIEAGNIPLEEKVYLKKDFLGWRVVHPIRNEDGSINYFNLIFGSKSNAVFLLLLLILGFGFYLGVNELIEDYKKIADDPCSFCTSCQDQCRKLLTTTYYNKNPIGKINISLINITK